MLESFAPVMVIPGFVPVPAATFRITFRPERSTMVCLAVPAPSVASTTWILVRVVGVARSKRPPPVSSSVFVPAPPSMTSLLDRVFFAARIRSSPAVPATWSMPVVSVKVSPTTISLVTVLDRAREVAAAL